MAHPKKNILLFNPSFSAGNMYLPYFWATAKTYYERNGLRVDEYNWINPLFNFYNNVDEIKKFIKSNPPSIFGISLYVWNHTIALEIASWVRTEFPDCLIISGGPHQYFKHESSWFADNPFLDASLAGDEYGELTVCDILDTFESRKNFNWNRVHAVVYPSKDRQLIMQSRKTSPKRQFKWDYSPYQEQYNDLKLYKDSMNLYDSSYLTQGLLETTRGCPYACTFCDWGGGTSTKIIARDLEYVKQDIDHLAKLDLNGVFFCDANYGILKERDVEIMQYIADIKKSYDRFFSLNYGGYAKTVHALPYIRQILEIEAKNHLTRSLTYKLSMQTLDQETLKNIDRTDVSFKEYQAISRYLQHRYGYDAYAEIIAGLPGITPDKFYHEISVFSDNNITMNFYDWYILPETPSYHKDYRKKYKLKTVKKLFGINEATNSYSGAFERESEIVVASYSYTEQEYKQMWISYAWYRTFWTAGFMSDTINKIQQRYNISLGEFIKEFYGSFFTDPNMSGKFLTELNQNINEVFDEFIDPEDTISKFLITTEYIKDADPVKLMAFTVFMRLDDFKQEIIDWVTATWPKVTVKEITNDIESTITYRNFLSKKGSRYYYNEVFAEETELSQVISALSIYLSSSIPVPPLKFLRAKKTTVLTKILDLFV